jgi:hypothetical protein
MKITIERWEELLQRTTKDNNWKSLHERFKTDNSYFREMKDTIDYVLNEFVEDDDDYKYVKESVDRNANTWKAFCESASVSFVKQWINDPNMRPSKYDIKQFQLLFIRPTKQDTFRTLPLEADWEVLDMMADLHKRNVDNGLSLDKAFGLEDPVGHPPKNPFEVPDFIRRMVVDMIDNDETQTQAIANEMSNLKTLTHSVDHYKHMMLKYKWTALNDHLHDRFLKGRKTLDERERKRIHKNWDGIYMPEILVISSDFVLYSKSTIKAKETQVIKSSSNLH